MTTLLGPGIKPKTMNAQTQGGMQSPPYLQMKTPPMPGMAPQPAITPKPSAMGDTVAPPQTLGPQGYTGPKITPAPQAGGTNFKGVYDFLSSDLANQAKQAKSNAIADHAARGLYYSSPLSGSEADIDTQYLRGLGQLQAGMYGNLQQNELARLGIAANLIGPTSQNMPTMPEPMDFSDLGALFANPSSARTGPVGPAITPANPVSKPNTSGGKPIKQMPKDNVF